MIFDGPRAEVLKTAFHDQGSYRIPSAQPGAAGVRLSPARVEIPSDLSPARDAWPFLYLHSPKVNVIVDTVGAHPVVVRNLRSPLRRVVADEVVGFGLDFSTPSNARGARAPSSLIRTTACSISGVLRGSSGSGLSVRRLSTMTFSWSVRNAIIPEARVKKRT